jgi:hypothetical protein
LRSWNLTCGANGEQEKGSPRERERERERDGSKRGKVVDVAGVALKAGSRRNGWGRQLRK